MASCTICATEFTFFENLTNWHIKRCKACDTRLKQIQQTAMASMEQAFQQGGVSGEMEQGIQRHFTEVRMPADLGGPVMQRLKYLRMLTEINAGNVPRIQSPGLLLDSDEYAHFEIQVTYFKPNKNIKVCPGRLIGTNKKCYFISDTGTDNATIDWNNVNRVFEQDIRVNVNVKRNGKNVPLLLTGKGIHMAVSKGSGGGNYQVPDPLYTRIIINTLVRLWKRQLVIYQETKTYGPVPEHIKAIVFKRDGGKCVECGYADPYIEYDHIFPRSKGGQNTVENIQLLCRGCNRKKGARV